MMRIKSEVLTMVGEDFGEGDELLSSVKSSNYATGEDGNVFQVSDRTRFTQEIECNVIISSEAPEGAATQKWALKVSQFESDLTAHFSHRALLTQFSHFILHLMNLKLKWKILAIMLKSSFGERHNPDYIFHAISWLFHLFFQLLHIFSNFSKLLWD